MKKFIRTIPVMVALGFLAYYVAFSMGYAQVPGMESRAASQETFASSKNAVILESQVDQWAAEKNPSEKAPTLEQFIQQSKEKAAAAAPQAPAPETKAEKKEPEPALAPPVKFDIRRRLLEAYVPGTAGENEVMSVWAQEVPPSPLSMSSKTISQPIFLIRRKHVEPDLAEKPEGEHLTATLDQPSLKPYPGEKVKDLATMKLEPATSLWSLRHMELSMYRQDLDPSTLGKSEGTGAVDVALKDDQQRQRFIPTPVDPSPLGLKLLNPARKPIILVSPDYPVVHGSYEVFQWEEPWGEVKPAVRMATGWKADIPSGIVDPNIKPPNPCNVTAKELPRRLVDPTAPEGEMLEVWLYGRQGHLIATRAGADPGAPGTTIYMVSGYDWTRQQGIPAQQLDPAGGKPDTFYGAVLWDFTMPTYEVVDEALFKKAAKPLFSE
jgi:hypothetical protein